MKLTKLDSFTKSLFSRAYPQYRGRKFYMEVRETPIDVRSWWDGGSRDYFVFVNLATGAVSQQVPAQSGFDKPIDGADRVSLPVGFACIRHSIFCGRESGLTIIVRPENAPRLLQEVSHAS